MDLWMALGGIAGAAVGAYSQNKKAQEAKIIGALAGGGIGVLAGWWIPRQMQLGAQVGQVAAGAIAAGAPAAYAGARDAYSQLPDTTPPQQQLPGKGSNYGVPGSGVTVTSSKDVGVPADSIEYLLDDAGIPSGEDESMLDLLRGNPFTDLMDSWTIE